MKYIGISYSVKNIDTPDLLWEIDEDIVELIRGERTESGIGFGWRDLEFELTESDSIQLDTIEKWFEEVMEKYNIEEYEFGTHSDEEDQAENDAAMEDFGFGI